MTHWKDVLCLLAIFVAYGLVGHLDDQDAVAMEDDLRADVPPPCSSKHEATADFARPTATKPPDLDAANARRYPRAEYLGERGECQTTSS